MVGESYNRVYGVNIFFIFLNLNFIFLIYFIGFIWYYLYYGVNFVI